VCDQTMKDLNVLGHSCPLAMISNQVHAHLSSPTIGV
jgi:hypothetical protein